MKPLRHKHRHPHDTHKASQTRTPHPPVILLPPNNTQVELRVLEHLRAHDPDDAHNVIHIGDHFTFRGHLCITFEMLSINLYEFIKQNNFVGLSLNLVRRFGSQMLQSLK